MTTNVNANELMQVGDSDAEEKGLGEKALPVLTDEQKQRLAWWQEARFGMFIHYGVYTATDQECWHMFMARTSIEDYYREFEHKLTGANFDAETLVKLAVDAGCKYIVIPTRHHEGYCLWDTDTTELNSVRGTPKRDFVAELMAAAHRNELKVGMYYSLLDWRYQAYWDGPYKDPAAWRSFVDFTHAQVKELVTRYGEIDIFWYDGAWPDRWKIGSGSALAEAWRSAELNAMIREHQPKILINDRSGLTEDFGTPEKELIAQNRPWELCDTIGAFWGYSDFDLVRKTPQQLIERLFDCVVQGGNMLLNVGPMPDGSVAPWQRETMEAIGAWLKRNGECIYGCGKPPPTVLEHWYRTRRDNHLYVLLGRNPGETLEIGKYQFPVAPSAASVLGSDGVITISETPTQFRFSGLPAEPGPEGTLVIKLTFPELDGLSLAPNHPVGLPNPEAGFVI